MKKMICSFCTANKSLTNRQLKWELLKYEVRKFTKEFYETFWNELKEIFINSVSETKEKGHLNTSQRQAFIRLIEKKR